MTDTVEAHHLMEQVHRHLDQLYQHSANQMEAIEQRSLESDDPFVAFDELDEHSLVVDQHLHQLNGNIDAIDRILNELSDENCHLHARLTTLRANLDGATARLHNTKRSDNQKSMKHWEELRVHLESCHSELTLTKDVLVRRMHEKQLKLTAEYVKNQEYENAVVELGSLKGDVVASNANELITLKSQLPPPIIDIFWHEVRLKFGQYYMEVKSTAVHRNFTHGMDWDYLSSKAGRHQFIPFNHGEEFELRNVTTQLRLIEKDQHLRWSAGEGDRWQLVPKRNQRFWIRSVRTGNYVCSCMAHGFGSLDADTENAIAIKFRCLRVDGDEEEEEGGHFDVEISKFELERESSECKMM
ncbi:hypothetical protein pipiens_017223 [Culex pipiens pipiens]|uniref:Uncharacterized protein n=1 Tax=Culex pipiens pipiens TaxID=38569 RepID=A0ABD1CHU0_CULPP